MTEAAKEHWQDACFVSDPIGNIFFVPVGPEHNEANAAGVLPEGGKLVALGQAIDPEFQYLFQVALSLYQLSVASRDLFVEHAAALDRAGTDSTIQLSAIFDQQAANLNLVIRRAHEGLDKK